MGQQTNLQLFFSPELVAGKQAPAVSGNLAPEQALQQLLQGSGLTYELSQGTVVVKPAESAGVLTTGSLELAPTDVKVVGDWLGMPSRAWYRTIPARAPWCVVRPWWKRAR